MTHCKPMMHSGVIRQAIICMFAWFIAAVFSPTETLVCEKSKSTAVWEKPDAGPPSTDCKHRFKDTSFLSLLSDKSPKTGPVCGLAGFLFHQHSPLHCHKEWSCGRWDLWPGSLQSTTPSGPKRENREQGREKLKEKLLVNGHVNRNLVT